jgi:hypothetical protein
MLFCLLGLCVLFFKKTIYHPTYSYSDGIGSYDPYVHSGVPRRTYPRYFFRKCLKCSCSATRYIHTFNTKMMFVCTYIEKHLCKVCRYMKDNLSISLYNPASFQLHTYNIHMYQYFFIQQFLWLEPIGYTRNFWLFEPFSQQQLRIKRGKILDQIYLLKLRHCK